ncbi:hypothetical protein [Paenibacillus montanisoli]|uniref:Uncharacterized protein n=1 Tax=Paenibacillus montanisoli TaxID=2081970 RepID=A0A328TZV2_9BACL|nr:hypothetical protein [Paenibacillus montanisoli]RAP74711.1 hypothetical protein DL346_21965 [Paenibacillus montanisoli]
MKKLILIILISISGLFFPIDVTKATIQSKKPLLKPENITSVQSNSRSGGSRLFKESDGYEEVTINKVIKWINESSLSVGTTEIEFNNPPTLPNVIIKMKNGNRSVIEPAYNCLPATQTKLCTIAEGEVIYAWNNDKVRLKSTELFDWLLVGWKYESQGAPKEELLDETLYSRYYSYLDKTYNDFIMCPKVDKIERINGDTRRHIVHASALNYSAHHGDVPYDRIRITLTDTPENGVKINEIVIQKGISEIESRKQCRREN